MAEERVVLQKRSNSIKIVYRKASGVATGCSETFNISRYASFKIQDAEGIQCAIAMAVPERLPDPTRVFSLLCISIMILRHCKAKGWPATLHGLFLNPFAVAFLCIATLTAFVANKHRQSRNPNPLSVSDLWAAEWYWWNAWLYHATMDGAAGSLRLVPVVVHTYDMLDKRFVEGDVVPWVVGLIELYVMHPLCLACVYTIVADRPQWRFPLELITSTLHIMGMILFVASELYQGQIHIPALDPVGAILNDEGMVDRWANVRFDLYHITFYWFGFWFCNLVWGWVPLIRIRRAVRECRLALESFHQTGNRSNGYKND